MGEHTFKLKTKSREEIIEKFIRISDALECDNTYNFRFSTSSIETAQTLLTQLDNSTEFDISVEGDISFKQQVDLSPYFKLLAVESLGLLNLTVFNVSANKYDQPFASLTLLKRIKYRGVTLEARAPNAKNKTEERAIFDYGIKLLNDSFEALDMQSTAVVGVSDGTERMWQKGNKGIVINAAESDTKNGIDFSVKNSRYGCYRIDFSSLLEEKNIEIAEHVFKQLINSAPFKKKQGGYTLWGKAFDIVQIIHKFPVPVTKISNVISKEIQANQSILKAITGINDFTGYLTLIRPYSFQNSLSDTLTLNLEGKQLYIGLSAGMTSATTIKKFKKMLSEKLNEEVLFEED